MTAERATVAACAIVTAVAVAAWRKASRETGVMRGMYLTALDVLREAESVRVQGR